MAKEGREGASDRRTRLLRPTKVLTKWGNRCKKCNVSTSYLCYCKERPDLQGEPGAGTIIPTRSSRSTTLARSAASSASPSPSFVALSNDGSGLWAITLPGGRVGSSCAVRHRQQGGETEAAVLHHPRCFLEVPCSR